MFKKKRGRPRINNGYNAIQIPIDVYDELKKIKGKKTWKMFFKELIKMCKIM